MDHRDDKGQPCARHAPLATPRLFELATLGSRMPGFHHDAASKLQSLMMALDELSELTGGADTDVRRAIEIAHGALRELNAIVAANRSLAKPPQRVRVGLADLLRTACERVGVKLRSALPAGDLRVPQSAVTHALALLIDLVAGPTHLGRVIDIRVEVDGAATITLSGAQEALAKQPPNASETIALAAFVIEREDGTLRCKSDANAIVLTLPIAAGTEMSQPLKRASTDAGSS